MSIPSTEEWFSLSTRRNRKSFILATLILNLILGGVILALWFFEARQRSGQILFLFFFAPYVICGYTLTAQRLRDMGITGWLALLWLVTGIADQYVGGAASLALFLVLCAVPGTQGPNRYGPDPLEDMWEQSG
ncbi:DUF805 domain-containing protein [Hoeflea halophila]|uniref:DUF805 domain-containing protein n=1 Tax=Hoeflea halophila TaxID=714899 RepID=UPI000BE3AFB9|nr:DUF805 domain-containing protein [Hoeflea halophila]